MPRNRLERPPRVERVLDILPPYLDGYEAICGHLARGDIDEAFDVAHNFAKNARPLKRRVIKIFEYGDLQKRRTARRRKK
tara:strand:+ start:592 stop:831 length:240 start_codon:yes stop_codon:yes gene_type:complete